VSPVLILRHGLIRHASSLDQLISDGLPAAWPAKIEIQPGAIKLASGQLKQRNDAIKSKAKYFSGANDISMCKCDE